MCVTVLHGVKDLAPSGKGRLARKGEEPPQGNMAPRAGHALIGRCVAAQPCALVGTGNCHCIVQKSAVVGAQRFIGDAGRVLVQHRGLPHGVKHRLAGFCFIACHVRHGAHTPLKQGCHLRINGVNLRPGLL